MQDAPERFCWHCGYDLRYSEKRCPECGTAFDAADASTCAQSNQGHLFKRWVRRAIILLIAAVILLLPAIVLLGYVLLWSHRGAFDGPLPHEPIERSDL